MGSFRKLEKITVHLENIHRASLVLHFVTLHIFNKSAKISQKPFSLCHYGVLSVKSSGEN